MALFRTGNYAANGDAVPNWRTDGKGRLSGILLTMSRADLPRPIAVAPIPAELPKMVELAAATRVRVAQDVAVRALSDLKAALVA